MQLLKPGWVSADGHALMSVDIHPDGTRFATGGQGTDCGRISIWNLLPVIDSKISKDKSTHKLLTQMDHHLGCVNCVRWSSDGKLLASGGDDKLVMLWQKSQYSGGSIFGGGGKVHVESWRLHHTLRGHNGDVLDLAWGPGDFILATASVDNTIIIWNLEKSPEQSAVLRGHEGLVKGVFFDPVGKFLASQSDDKTLRIWRTSDWSQEAVIQEPFQESGGTTHVLRPGWSPDGSILVSAHAMNGGGPTAQIIDRNGWKAQRDFVGHKKAVSCVRFNGNIFEKKTDKTDMFVMVALGSRDRSFSVWTTNLKRPFFVVNDAFDQSVLDLSWSRDGRVLLACSMDGSVAAVVLGQNEIGRPLSENKLFDMMSGRYGKNFGTVAKSASKSNGSCPVIENPAALKKATSSSKKDTDSVVVVTKTNGHSNSIIKSKLHPRGPTDKQIEARTSDGRRRITPIYIPPPTVENGTTENGESAMAKFGTGEFGSSSTQEKSRIAIEKRDDIVKPNISPGKHSDNSNSMAAPVSTPTVKEAKPKEPPVNIIQVKKKPGPISLHNNEAVIQPPKRKRVAVLSDSSEDEDKAEELGDTEDDSSVSVTSVASRQNKDEVNKEFGSSSKDTKLKEAKMKKPDLMTSATTIACKRKNEDSSVSLDERPKKRGRPPLQREKSVTLESHELEKQPTEDSISKQVPTTTLPITYNKAPLKLPVLKIDKSRVYNFSLNCGKVTVSVHNNCLSLPQGSMHQIKARVVLNAHKGGTEWQVAFSSPISTLTSSDSLIIAACRDGSLYLFKPDGQQMFPPWMMPSGLSKIVTANNRLAVVTSCAHLYVWNLSEEPPKVVLRREPVQCLLTNNNSASEKMATVARLSFNEADTQPVIITSWGKSYLFNPDLGTWLRLTDTCSSVQAASNYNTASANLPADTKGMPLSCLGYLTPTGARIQKVSEETRRLASITHCKNQKMAAQYLKSPKEYRYWFLAEIKHLAEEGNVEELRKTFAALLGPVHSASRARQEKILGMAKEELLKSALDIIAGNLELQRLYSEYQEQLESGDLLKEVEDNLLDI